MNKIRIVNWLLTRKCNLSCDYCAIVKNYKGKPKEYPDMKHYIKNEMSTQKVIESLKRFKNHNPDAFHIFYGGEPLLRKDLSTIINFCNKENIHYTIISNNTVTIQPLIEQLINDVEGKIKGFTASIDPVLFSSEESLDRIRKSIQGFNNLKYMKKYVNDVVAEITVMKDNQKYLFQLLTLLTKEGINSDITFIDISKSPYYDFSNISDENLLIKQSTELEEQFKLIMDSKLDIHMKEVLIPEIWKILPSNMDCGIEKKLHNISVDADGSIRLCLRIRGVHTPGNINLDNLFDSDNQITYKTHMAIMQDKHEYCKLCNHTCHLMSKYIDKNNKDSNDLVHLDRRK